MTSSLCFWVTCYSEITWMLIRSQHLIRSRTNQTYMCGGRLVVQVEYITLIYWNDHTTHYHPHPHGHTHTRTHTLTQTNTHEHTHTSAHTHTRAHTHIHMYVCAHTHTHTHAHTHILILYLNPPITLQETGFEYFRDDIGLCSRVQKHLLRPTLPDCLSPSSS